MTFFYCIKGNLSLSFFKKIMALHHMSQNFSISITQGTVQFGKADIQVVQYPSHNRSKANGHHSVYSE